MEIEITSLSSTGEGVGSLDGLKVFVEGALPGERALVALTQRKKNYAKARLISLITRSDQRTEPICPVFGRCGGCQLMHLNYPGQLESKRQRVQSALERIADLRSVRVMPCIPSPMPFGYRNKIQIPVQWENGKKKVGFYRKASHELIPIKKCFIQCPQGEKIFETIEHHLSDESVRHVMIRSAQFREESLILFVTENHQSTTLKSFSQELCQAHPEIKGVVQNWGAHGNAILGPSFLTLTGSPFIYEQLGNKLFKISGSSFFQVNPPQALKLYAHALDLAAIGPNDTVVDGYCGVGTLALFAAEKAKKVIGIECVADAIRDAQENAQLNDSTNCSFIVGKAEELIKKLPSFSTIFINPPRKGCEESMIAALLARLPARIIYISCDPATLARDLALLAPRYTLSTAQPFDMFPQTMHVETVVCLDKR